jgi:hypothetical protein
MLPVKNRSHPVLGRAESDRSEPARLSHQALDFFATYRYAL